MGSFYSTCSVTGMSLTHQKVVRLLLVPSALSFEKYDDDTSSIRYDSRNFFKEKGLLVSNEGAQAVFSPFGFPIRGTYDDCGDIDNIERDRNVEKLEEYFELPIEKILLAASDDRWYEYGIKRPKECKDEIAKAEAQLESYKEQFREKVSEELVDSLVGHIAHLKEKYNYEINESPKSWKISDNEPSHMNILLRLTYTDIRAEIYDFLVEKQSKSKEWWMKYSIEEAEKFFTAMDEKKNLEDKDDPLSFLNIQLWDIRTFIPSLCKDNFLISLNIDRSWEGEYWNLYYFLIALGSLRKILLPSNYGSQEDNFNLLTALNKKANALMREDKKER